MKGAMDNFVHYFCFRLNHGFDMSAVSCLLGHEGCLEGVAHNALFARFVARENEYMNQMQQKVGPAQDLLKETVQTQDQGQCVGAMSAITDLSSRVEEETPLLESSAKSAVAVGCLTEGVVAEGSGDSKVVPVITSGSQITPIAGIMPSPKRGARPKVKSQSDFKRTARNTRGGVSVPRERPTTRPRILFKSEDHPLSNLFIHELCPGTLGSACEIKYRGFSFRTSEHAYQFEKARRHGEFRLCWEILGPLRGVDKVRAVMKKGQALYTLPIWKNGHKFRH